jgi:hypothetical protein
LFHRKGLETIDKYKLSMAMHANLRISDFRRLEPENPARTAVEQIDD